MPQGVPVSGSIDDGASDAEIGRAVMRDIRRAIPPGAEDDLIAIVSLPIRVLRVIADALQIVHGAGPVQ